MKIYTKPEPDQILRVTIKKQKIPIEHIYIDECEQMKFYAFLKKLIEQLNISPFETGKVTSVEIQNYKAKGIGKIMTLSFKGLNPKEVKELLIKNIPK